MKRSTLLILMILMFAGINIHAQTTEFTYQGQLKSSSAQANGNHDFEFALFDSLSGGAQLGSTITLTNVAVTDGVFSVQLNFGSQFPGANRFLEIHVRQSGGGAFTPLTPRQVISSAPYSIKSLDAVNATSATTATNATQLGGVAANQYILTGDVRLTDARDPLPNSPNYIQNQIAATQASSNFNISGTGKAGVFNATTQYDIGGNRVLSISGAPAFLNSNTFVGVNAGINNTPGVPNSTAGIANSFFGSNAGTANTTGFSNTFFGRDAGQNNTTGGSNSFFGVSAGANNTMGNSNVFVGQNAGVLNSTGGGNSFVGIGSGFNNTGNSNSFFGTNAGQANTTGANNTIIGRSADVGSGALSFATAIGSNAVVSTSNTVVLGRAADTVQVPGDLNVVGGSSFSGTLGANIFNATTQYNIGGVQVLSVAGSRTILVGVGAGNLTMTGNNNSFVGEGAGDVSTTGSRNSFFGNNAGQANTTGFNNSFFGDIAGLINSTGGNNSFFGKDAGNANTTGSSNTIIGTFANVGSGALNFATAIGSSAVVNADDTIVLGKVAGTYNSVARPADAVVVPGFLYREYTASTPSAAIPIAYGSISGTGTILGGTGNFTVAAHSVTGEYDITITGETYSNSTFTVTTTPVSNSPRITAVADVGTAFRVNMWNLAGTLVDNAFQFTIWKTNPN